MKKQVLFLLCLVALPLFGQQNAIDIKLAAPENVIAGSDFEVTITFNKGDLKDYSRFSQDLPAGFKASNIESPNADFTFTEQRVRIIWLKLPANDLITVKYSISVDERLIGELNLGGTFAFVKNGERAYIDLPEVKKVRILRNPQIDQALVVDVKDFNKPKQQGSIATGGEFPARNFANIIRQKPEAEANGIVYVTLLVKKPEGTNFLKLEESIPGGYSFESLESSNAVVSQAASIARYVWMRPPAAATFILKYRLIPILEKKQEALMINGTLTFTSEGETKISEVREVKVPIASLDTEQQLELLATGIVPDNLSGTSQQLAKTNTTQNGATRTNQLKSNESGSKTSAVTAVKQGSGVSGANKGDLEKGSGVYFRIQIAALKKTRYAESYFEEYTLLREAKVEKIGDWNKYTVGPVYTYEDALKLKNRIITETPVNNAFIVAYKNGNRVPVSDVK